jgi:hypothetical protein
MRKFLGIFLTVIIMAGIMACQGEYSQSVSGQCDRQCLESFVGQYLDAMVKHDASQAPFAENVKFTENAKILPLTEANEGLWVTSTGVGDYKFYIYDPQAGQVAYVGLVEEGDKLALLSLRLKVENRQITEVESIVVHNMNERNLQTLVTPPPGFSEALAPEERVSREELINISNLYFDSIEQLRSDIVPWHDDCYRIENGMWTAGLKLPDALAAHMPETPSTQPGSGPGGGSGFRRSSCSAGIDSGGLGYIESIRPRHVPVVDEERGVTWGVYVFNHPGMETITMADGSTRKAMFAGNPNSMPISELFKIKGGKILDIMAIAVRGEYMCGTGWE